MSGTSSPDGGVHSPHAIETDPDLDLSADIRVLCVDDEQEVLELTATYLERQHDEITALTAASPDAALDRLAEEAVSCIVSDYQMPGMDGIEFLTTVRERHPNLPFILFTGQGSEAVASDAIAADVTDYLQKETGQEQYEILANKVERAVVSYRARRELTAREERFRKLVEGSTDMIVILDEVGTFEFVSQSVERLMGYQPAELVGENAFDLMHPDDEEDIWEVFQEAVADPTYRPTREFRYEHADGSWRWLEAHGRNLLEDPSIEGFVVNVRDISDRMAVHRRYQSLFERSPAAVAVLDETGEIKYTSASMEELSGYDQSEYVGENAFEFVHPDDREEMMTEFAAALESDYPRHVEYRYLRPDGEVRWAQATGRDLRDNPAVEGFVVNVLDVTERKEREQELQEERAFIETVLDTVQDLVYVFDPEGKPIRWNERANEILGYTDEEIETMDAFDFIADEDQDAVAAGIEEVLEEGSARTEARVETTDGEYIPYQFYGVRLTGPDGEVRGLCGVGRDISERVDRDRELERFETAVETVADGIYITDETGRYEYVNQAFAKTVGMDREELVGEEVPLFMDEAEIEETETAISEMLRGERDAARTESEMTTADGETIAVENRYTILPTDGEYRGTVGVMRDITERKERERELERYEVLLEEVADGVSFVDADGRYTYVNSYIEDKTGYDREELIGESPTTIMSTDAVEQFEVGIREVLAGERDTYTTEFDVHPKAGEPYPVESKMAPLVTDGAFQGNVAVSRDISSRKERQRELERQNERLNEFASVVSHDLRNPLEVATGHLELLREECASDHLDPMETSLGRMDTLIDDLLSLAKQGEAVEALEPVEVGELAHRCWATVDTAEATLVVDTDQVVQADRSRLKQALENLIRNAVEHGGADVTITIGELDGGFYVADDGGGLPEGDRDRLFEGGFSTAPETTGFGLSIVQAIVDAHGWTIRATESEQGGARFEVTGVTEAIE